SRDAIPWVRAWLAFRSVIGYHQFFVAIERPNTRDILWEILKTTSPIRVEKPSACGLPLRRPDISTSAALARPCSTGFSREIRAVHSFFALRIPTLSAIVLN